MIIKKVQKLGDPSGNFTLYTIGVEMEDGSKYVAFAKKNPPPYVPGDTVEVTPTGKTHEDTGHPQAGIKKPQGNGGGGSGYSNQTQGKPQGAQHAQNGSEVYGATVGMAIKEAVNMLIATGKQDEANWPEYVETRARAIIAMALRLESGKPPLAEPAYDSSKAEPETGPQDIDEDESIPF